MQATDQENGLMTIPLTERQRETVGSLHQAAMQAAKLRDSYAQGLIDGMNIEGNWILDLHRGVFIRTETGENGVEPSGAQKGR